MRPGPLPVTAVQAWRREPHTCPAMSLLSLGPALEGLVPVTEVSELRLEEKQPSGL